MPSLKVDLGERSYPITIAKDSLDNSDLFLPHIESPQVMIVSNATVFPLFSDRIKRTLRAVERVDVCVLPDGEQYKDLSTLNLIFDALLNNRHNRKTTILALGGGVVGDMAGFAAACYQRGVHFIQVPTTLLSQVDSSVGGKTGVNHAAGKNMIGAFHQPQCVVIDVGVLDSLPNRELSAGLAEVIKYGLIADIQFLEWLENNMDALLARDESALTYAIERSCFTKARIVAKDEKESGIRALLNFGHTFGHAIEAHQGYGNWLHGEAVGAGMVLASELSRRMGWINAEDFDRVRALIARAKLPVAAPSDMTPEVFLQHMAVDKKVLDKKLRLILLKRLGEAMVTDKFDDEALNVTLAIG